ncbi:hypothetical protein AAG570_013523 [Ranatra chinensis]|uniref:protein xylosyltransferase n=1 Tax=Ranatra chinensis TaxID=642074 RepID=A0ABD0YCN6_9HEMI
MAVSRALDVRWIRRYRVFCIGGCVVLAIQVFLAYRFITIDGSYESGTQDQLSGKGKLNVEVLDDRNSVESSRRFRDGYLGVDDEEDDPLGNSNAVYNRVKVPPDKPDSNLKLDSVPIRTVSAKSSDGNKTRVGSLRLEELDFVPMCEITGKEAVSAIHRARTQHCKQEIANTTCLIAFGQLYPERLPHSCSAPDLVMGKSLGCFQDNKASRLLQGFYSNLKNSNSPLNCINLCLQSGFPYAGVQYGSECFCDNEEPPSTARLPDSSCNMKCPGDPKEACGGYYTINIYQTGVAKLTPQVAKEGTPLGHHPPVRIAFLLTLNGRAVRQVKRLIKALFHRDHFFYIHVDARQDYLVRELMSLEMRLGNVRLSRRRHATIWGGASLLSMLLEAMTDLVNSAWDWDFVINLSESDFPVKTNTQLVEFLSANRRRNFVKSHGREAQRFIQKQGLDKSFVECEAHMWRVGDRTLPWGIVIDGGSDWLALSRPFVHYLTTSTTDPLLKGLITLFKYTLLPAESFFHTALRNSKFCDSYVDNNLHVTNWRRKLGCKCQYKHVVDWCGCSPNNFKPEDWARLQGTEGRSLYFARKFEPVINQAIINKLDEWLYGPYPPNVTNINSYWQSVYSEADMSPPPDDALITICNSLARINSRLLSSVGTSCIPVAGKLLDITSYHHLDEYRGSLIMYESHIKDLQSPIKIEVWIKPVEFFSILKPIGPISRLKTLVVSSDYDQKEQTSRNFMRVIGPFTEVTAIFHLSAGDSTQNVTFIWIDPIGAIAEVTEVSFEDVACVGFTKPSLKTPMLPGAWEIKVVWNRTLCAQTRFLVSPLQMLSKSPLTHHQA